MRYPGGGSQNRTLHPHDPGCSKYLVSVEATPKAQEREHPATLLTQAFVFSRPGDPLEPRDPSAITRHMKRFVKTAGLPDVSPHDLRHSCASLLLSSGADIKSVQELLGPADASTTLNFYVKTDLKQMRSATEKYAKAFGL